VLYGLLVFLILAAYVVGGPVAGTTFAVFAGAGVIIANRGSTSPTNSN
jgi:hypothetical protein